MLLLKACPRCHGDLAMDSDRRCGYLDCVQCGHILSRDEERALGVRCNKHGLMHIAVPHAQLETAGPQELTTGHLSS